jgi:hypothetical protein
MFAMDYCQVAARQICELLVGVLLDTRASVVPTKLSLLGVINDILSNTHHPLPGINQMQLQLEGRLLDVVGHLRFEIESVPSRLRRASAEQFIDRVLDHLSERRIFTNLFIESLRQVSPKSMVEISEVDIDGEPMTLNDMNERTLIDLVEEEVAKHVADRRRDKVDGLEISERDLEQEAAELRLWLLRSA